MVYAKKDHGFNELSLNDGTFDLDDRFAGENRRAFGDRPDIAAEFEIAQLIEKYLAEAF